MSDLYTRVSLEMIIRKGIMVVMIVVFCLYFAYDGFIGYPRKNLLELKKAHPELIPVEHPTANPAVTVAVASAIAQDDSLKRVKDMVARIGEPDYRSDDGTTVAYWGAAAALKLTTIGGDYITDKQVIKAKQKSEMDFFIQKGLALVLAIVAVPWFVHYIKVLTFHARLTDEGLKRSDKPFVPFDAMTAVDTSRFADKRWIDITYTLDGKEGTLRVDDYWFKEYKAFITEVCRRKGVENPLDAGKKAPGKAPPADADQPGDK